MEVDTILKAKQHRKGQQFKCPPEGHNNMAKTKQHETKKHSQDKTMLAGLDPLSLPVSFHTLCCR